MTTESPARPGRIDTDALRRRYAEERDKRLRPDGNDQYLRLTGEFAHYLDDPYTPWTERAPRTDHRTVVCIGGGFAGLVTATRLREADVDVRIIEKGGDFGGTWYWNRYPGAQCDTASMVYLPLLEETGHMPTEKYVHGSEILAHCQRIGRQFGLYDDALFHTEVTGLTWDEARTRWVIETSRGDRLTATFVVLGTGPLSVPKLPGIPGIGSFGGHSFHTSRWDYGYTGGNPQDQGCTPMHKLTGKSVGIIGTGATAVQCVPHLSRDSRALYVFQRTPSSVDVRNNHPIDPDWFAKIATPGWQQRWLENFTANQAGGTADEDLVQDGWTDIARRIRARIALLPPEDLSPAATMAAYEESDFEKMEEIRARADAIVRDAGAARNLKAWYRQLCKRPCFHDEYLQAFNRPNTHLVDTGGKGVAQITATGVIAAGREYSLDCIIYASGFEVGTPYTRRAGFEVTRPRRRAVGLLGRRDADAARHPRPRVPEPAVRAANAGREPDLQRAAQHRRLRPDHRGDYQACPGPRVRHRRGVAGRRGRVGHAAAVRTGQHDRRAGLHAGLLQQRGPGLGRVPWPRLPLRPQRLLCLHRQVARIRHVRWAGVPLTTAASGRSGLSLPAVFPPVSQTAGLFRLGYRRQTLESGR